VDDLISKGAREASDYKGLADASDVIILCVSNSRVAEEVVSGLMPGLRAEMMVIDTGTSSPESTRLVHGELAKLGVSFIESPVTGGVKQAAAGELGALVGAMPADFEAVRPVLETICRTVHYFGPPGMGNTAKLLNNYMVLGIAALVVEAFGKARDTEVDWRKLYDVVICGSADSGVLRRIIGSALEGDYRGYVFSVENSLKDIQYFEELSRSMGGLSELGRAVTHVFEKAVAEGHGDMMLSELLSPELKHGHDTDKG
jgi:3-hydroxyisobutyrate dehydrogenase-like beta-hydroxyacid dehydrogenase